MRLFAGNSSAISKVPRPPRYRLRHQKCSIWVRFAGDHGPDLEQLDARASTPLGPGGRGLDLWSRLGMRDRSAFPWDMALSSGFEQLKALSSYP